MTGKVAIIMGSQSDSAVAQAAEGLLKEFGVPSETLVISAHRNPNTIRAFARSAEASGFRVIIAAAGLAAGAVGALVYTLHCPELEAPFLALWYVLGMLLPAALGAWVGPRLLRW